MEGNNTDTNHISRQKRKFEVLFEADQAIDAVLHTPKKEKLLGTEKYIHQTLFLEGQKSDVTVCMLGEEFNLHKVLLCQSPYFASMFNGSWTETTQRNINILTVDPHITIDSLKVALGSLYNSEISIKPVEVVSILATAMMFQLEGLIEKCTNLMIETINQRTVLEYYEAGCQYENKRVEEKCFEWLLVNFVICIVRSMGHFKKISKTLLVKLLNHPELIVFSEIMIYIFMKFWVYFQENPEIYKFSPVDVKNYYSSKTGELPFLLTSDGEQYVSIFKALRLQNVTIHKNTLEIIIADNIIPKTWLDSIIVMQWNNILTKNIQDKGPADISDEMFLKKSLRIGDIITLENESAWKLYISNFSKNLVLTMEGSTLSILREDKLLSFKGAIHIMIRVKIMKQNQQHIHSQQSEILRVALKIDEKIRIMSLDERMTYPFFISTNILDITSDIEETTVETMDNVQALK